MMAKTPPMGWNTWNTFGQEISETLIFEMADVMAKEGYLEAGYEYLVIDDCWSEKERNSRGELVADHVKFPHGMKAVADYVHSRGLKFGIYSCTGILTCAGYPSSYDHEFQDAKQFAQWGVDFLKYDFCNFPDYADCKNRYLLMSMALKACGREILFSACNWGQEESWNWMRSIGAHMYRSTGDIFDNFRSFTGIFQSQMEHFCQSAPGCFNDLDMLTVGMYNKGNAAIGKPCTDEEYKMQFALWCLAGSPLFLGADIREIRPQMKELLQNRDLIAIDQDEDCRPPYLVSQKGVNIAETDTENAVEPLRFLKDRLYIFLKQLSGNSFVIAYCNLHTEASEMLCSFAELGIPYASGYRVAMKDVFTGKDAGLFRDYHRTTVEGHSCQVYRCSLAGPQKE